MNGNDGNVYDGYSKPDLIAQAHLAAMENERRKREEAEKCQILELEEIALHQPNDFAD